jgi:hypothetical protein
LARGLPETEVVAVDHHGSGECRVPALGQIGAEAYLWGSSGSQGPVRRERSARLAGPGLARHWPARAGPTVRMAPSRGLQESGSVEGYDRQRHCQCVVECPKHAAADGADSAGVSVRGGPGNGRRLCRSTRPARAEKPSRSRSAHPNGAGPSRRSRCAGSRARPLCGSVQGAEVRSVSDLLLRHRPLTLARLSNEVGAAGRGCQNPRANGNGRPHKGTAAEIHTD